MILYKKWTKQKVKSYIYCVNQLFCNAIKNEAKNVKLRKTNFLFIFYNIFDLLTSRTNKIIRWTPVFKPDFQIFSYNEQPRNM